MQSLNTCLHMPETRCVARARSSGCVVRAQASRHEVARVGNDASLEPSPSTSFASRRSLLAASAAAVVLGSGTGRAFAVENVPNVTPEAAKIAKLYDSYAATYDVLDGGALATSLGYDELRDKLVGQAKGTILEVGVGTGLNLPYYRWNGVSSVTASDVSLEMITLAARRANSDEKVIGQPVAFQPADVANLPFPDHTFDTVIDTFSLCVFPNPEKALSEMVRVVKPGGRVLLLEHTRSDNPVLGIYQDLTNDYVKKMSKECSWNQNVPALVSKLPVKNVKVERHLAGTIIALTLSSPRISTTKPANA